MPKSFINDTYWKKKIPNWKEYQLRSPDNKTFKQPSCADAGAMINYTVRPILKVKNQSIAHCHSYYELY